MALRIPPAAKESRVLVDRRSTGPPSDFQVDDFTRILRRQQVEAAGLFERGIRRPRGVAEAGVLLERQRSYVVGHVAPGVVGEAINLMPRMVTREEVGNGERPSWGRPTGSFTNSQATTRPRLYPC